MSIPDWVYIVGGLIIGGGIYCTLRVCAAGTSLRIALTSIIDVERARQRSNQ